MNTCAQNRFWGVDLDRLNDEQFDKFLDHAVSCRVCDEMLMKYENNFAPVLKEALSEELKIPIQVILAANGQLWSSAVKESCTKLYNSVAACLDR